MRLFHMKSGVRKLLFGALAAFLSQLALGQLVVDATVPIRNRLRNPTSGRAGSIGRKLPLQITINVNNPVNDTGMTTVDFMLTNTSKEAITLPISLHPRDFEPVDPTLSYTVRVLSLVVTSGSKQQLALSGKTDLYGSQAYPESWIKLAPGESLRVLTRATLRRDVIPGHDQTGTVAGHISLVDQTISNSNSETSEDSEELGSADSADFTIHSPGTQN